MLAFHQVSQKPHKIGLLFGVNNCDKMGKTLKMSTQNRKSNWAGLKTVQ